MTRYALDFDKLINWLLPRAKRKPVRIAWLYALMVRIRAIHTDFISTGTALSAQARVNSQCINLEAYLISRFGAGIIIEPQLISANDAYIGDNDEAGFYIGDNDDALYYLSDADGSSIYNAIVKVPAAIEYDEDELRAILDKYKVPGSNYLIQEI